jgi:CHAT domain-containing protein
LPSRAQEFLRKHHNRPIQFVTNKSEIPWELLHDGQDYLCLSRPFARKPQEVSEPRALKPLPKSDRTALIVGNPTGDLPGAEQEAQDIASLLKTKGWDVELLLTKNATSTKFALSIQNRRYRLIHFAGHGAFGREGGKIKSRLSFSDGDLLDEDLERQLKSPAFIFLSACQAGQSTSQEVTHGFRGNFTEGMAVSALRGGATHCLGPMWLIGDSLAHNFALAFYRYMIRKETLGESVRLARLDVKDKSPDFWAAWVLYGDPCKPLIG